MARATPQLIKPFRVIRGHPRLILAVVLGVVVALALPHSLRGSTRLLIGWDCGAIFYLTTAFILAQQFDIKRARLRAGQYDEGALLILVLTVAAAVISLAAIVVELGASHNNDTSDRFGLALAAGTTMLSWGLIHMMFAFHYAHRCHGDLDQSCRGLAFPQEEHPNYWDFIYFSFVIGMTFQVSDVQVTSTPMRRLVVAHGVISFFFSVAILALAINMGASML
jgi:uncharacterized membrane protein